MDTATLCVVCEATFMAQRSTARFCSERCKKRAQRSPGGVDGPLTSPSPSVEPATYMAPQDGARGGVYGATFAELSAAGRTTTSLGQVALALAERLDDGSGETGSSLASVAREWRAVLAVAVQGAVKISDPVDELQARREGRSLRAVGG